MTRSRPRAVPRWGVRFGVVLLVCVAVLAGGPFAAAADGSAASAASATAPAAGSNVADDRATGQEQPSLAQAVDADRTYVDVTLDADGDAALTFEFRVRLEDDEAREAFESLQDDVAADPENFSADFEQRMVRTAETASASTGREMAIEDVTVETGIDEILHEYGVLTYQLRWTNFAAVEGETLHAGDAIDGFPMEEGTRLTVRWGEACELQSATPDPDSSTATRVTWRGAETEFVRGEPRVSVGPPSDRSWLLPALAVLGLLAVAGLGAWLYRRGTVGKADRAPAASRSADGAGATGETAAAEAGGTSTGTTGAGTAAATSGDGSQPSGSGADPSADPGEHDAAASDSQPSEEASSPAATGGEPGGAPSNGEASAGDESADGEADSSEGDGGDSDDDSIPQELLSNEEQVVRVLEDHGGRAKQQQVVSELGWTEAKTSQVVTGMHDDGDIEKFRIGRENVLALPGEADL